jgi:hypothetical protein
MEIQKTKSVCPKCKEVIGAVLSNKDNKVIMEKRCEKHGTFEEIIYDTKQFERVMRCMKYVSKSKNIPACPYDCENCPGHPTQTLLAIMDVTNRCNLNCRYCFANSARCGYLYEPSLPQVKDMLSAIRKRQPTCGAILFSGGEPTIRDDLPEIVRMARDTGFGIQLLATNGYRLANDLEYVKKLNDAGLYLLYLSFDGLSDATNHEKRNHLLIDKLIGNCRRSETQMVLVPTISRENSHEAWKLIKFAAGNMDVIRGVNFQPLSFCGRMEPRERDRLRYTISDLSSDIEKQSEGVLKEEDFYPIPAIIPFQKMLCELGGVEMPLFNIHPLCGRATYLFLDEGRLVPITKVMDVPQLLSLFDLWSERDKSKGGLSGSLSAVGMINQTKRFVHLDKMPKKSNAYKLLAQLILKRDLKSAGEFQANALFIGIMHFQDCYNMDLERLQRCGIHYVTPNNSLIPFCAYNPLGYRERIEAKFSVPLGEKK